MSWKQTQDKSGPEKKKNREINIQTTRKIMRLWVKPRQNAENKHKILIGWASNSVKNFILLNKNQKVASPSYI